MHTVVKYCGMHAMTKIKIRDLWQTILKQCQIVQLLLGKRQNTIYTCDRVYDNFRKVSELAVK